MPREGRRRGWRPLHLPGRGRGSGCRQQRCASARVLSGRISLARRLGAPAMNREGRLASIDILRGFAIVWVISYHLWTDLRFPDVYPRQSDAFREVPRQLADADALGAIAAAFGAFLRVGYMGVPLRSEAHTPEL